MIESRAPKVTWHRAGVGVYAVIVDGYEAGTLVRHGDSWDCCVDGTVVGRVADGGRDAAAAIVARHVRTGDR